MADLSSLADLKAAEPQVQPVHERKVDAQGRAYATGKRKNAIARVWVKPGTGQRSWSTAATSPTTSPVRCCAC